jgi:hypothetical protein
MRVVGYTYEADVHCVGCAFDRFGDMLDRDEAADSEGNRPHPVFSIDEDFLEEHDACSTCGDRL